MGGGNFPTCPLELFVTTELKINIPAYKTTSMFHEIVELCCYLRLDMARELSQDYANYFLNNNVEKEVSLKANLSVLLAYCGGTFSMTDMTANESSVNMTE